MMEVEQQTLPVASPVVLLVGTLLRVPLYCATVSVVRKYILKKDDENTTKRIKRRAFYAGVDTVANAVLVSPAMAAVTLNVPRFLVDVLQPTAGRLLGLIDGYYTSGYVGLAQENVGIDNPAPFFANVITSVVVNMGLYWWARRNRRAGKISKKKFAAAVAVQSLARFTNPTFIVVLPQEESEILYLIMMALAEKYATSWLAAALTQDSDDDGVTTPSENNNDVSGAAANGGAVRVAN
eukprot:PhM_4_TR14277/c0_g2_i1/m.4857